MSSPMQDGLMWRCAACGERNFNHYENCVSCGRARLAGDPKPWQPEAVTGGSPASPTTRRRGNASGPSRAGGRRIR